MSTPVRRIGVLTGGGDCPGLNAVIRAVTKDAMHNGIEVLGIEDGFLGLIENRVRPLDLDSVSGILTAGGTILGSSNKANPKNFATGVNDDGTPIFEDVTDQCIKNVHSHALDALVVIGGDGTMTAASNFVERGVDCVGVPKTIDNDLFGTDITFGFMTAVQIATNALDRVHTSAASHHRVMVVEVMGRNAGWIALHAGVAAGADVILLPEIPFDIDKVCESIHERAKRGKRFSIVCCSEGAAPKGGAQMVERTDPTSPDPIRLGGIAKWTADTIEDRTGIESRYVVLGHVQRGGTPVAGDRVLATQLGDHAMELLKAGTMNRMVVMQGFRLGDVAITECADKQRTIPADNPLIAAARSVYTSFGD
jgi:phosphofructokinase-like protein